MSPRRIEKDYQRYLIKYLHRMFPGCIILKNDPSYIQGIPDLIILHLDKWAALEVKKSARESKRPNQEYYVDKLNDMGFAAIIYPENEAEILDALQLALRP